MKLPTTSQATEAVTDPRCHYDPTTGCRYRGRALRVRAGGGEHSASRLAWVHGHGDADVPKKLDRLCDSPGCLTHWHYLPANAAREIQHGTVSAYLNRGCRCDVCKESRRVYAVDYRKRLQRGDCPCANPNCRVPAGAKHGLRTSRARYGCWCTQCTEAADATRVGCGCRPECEVGVRGQHGTRGAYNHSCRCEACAAWKVAQPVMSTCRGCGLRFNFGGKRVTRCWTCWFAENPAGCRLPGPGEGPFGCGCGAMNCRVRSWSAEAHGVYAYCKLGCRCERCREAFGGYRAAPHRVAKRRERNRAARKLYGNKYRSRCRSYGTEFDASLTRGGVRFFWGFLLSVWSRGR